MPVLILLGIGAVYGITRLVDRCTPSKYNFENMTEKERTQFVIEQNQKRIDKIMRKYR